MSVVRRTERLELRTLLSGTPLLVDSGQALGSASTADVALGDVDGDGDIDAVAGNVYGYSRLWMNDGDGQFTGGQQLGYGASRGVALGDLDGDGDLDAFLTRYSYGDRVWLNDGNGNFSDSGQSLGSSSGNDVALGDLDGDGDLDAFVANYYQADRVWLNDGDGNFTDSGQALSDEPSAKVALGDLDGDGDLDAFVANYGGSGSSARVWLNDGSGGMTSGATFGSYVYTRGLALGDLDGDGDLDAFVADYFDSDRIWRNNGNANFSAGPRIGTSQSKRAALGDLEGDGDLDLFVAKRDGLEVWSNDGSGSFSNSETHDLNMTSAVAVGDLDGDGDLDAFVGRQYYNSNRVFLNGGDGGSSGGGPVETDVTLPAGGGTFEVLLMAADLVVRTQGGSELYRQPIADVPLLTINGSSDDDTLIVDFSAGTPIPAGGIAFDAGGESSAGDTLELSGGAFATVAHTFANAHDGSIDLDGSTIDYTGLEPILDEVSAADRVFTFGAASDVITVGDGTSAGDGITRIESLASSETVDFANPTGTLTIHAGPGNDNVTFTAVDALFAAGIEVNGQDGSDTLDAAALSIGVTLAGGDGNDSLVGSAAGDLLDGGEHRDTLEGNGGADRLFGGMRKDSLDGGAGNDSLFGEGGRDSLAGRAGDDLLDGGLGRDQALEKADMDITVSDVMLVGQGTDSLISIEIARLIGGDSANTLDATQFTGKTVLNGRSGDDTLMGGSSKDLLKGESGNDSLMGYDGNDVLNGGDDDDRLNGGAGNDRLMGGEGHD